MKELTERIEKHEILLVDGAMGTMLLGRGLTPGDCPESLNLTRPGVLEAIAGLYLDAGADILETNTFGASPMKLSQYDLEDRTEEINEAAVRAVRGVVGERAFVAGCCGPSGRLLKPHGDTDPEVIYAGFRRQLECLIGAGVDAVIVETMMDLTEASIVVRAAKDVSPGIPVTATMTFDTTPRGSYTVMGVTVEQAAAGLREAGADAVGANCGHGIETMVAIAREFRSCIETPLIVQSNAGLPEVKDGVAVHGETPEFMADKANGLLDAGVSLIGGCCGTTPEHIRALRTMIDATTSLRPGPPVDTRRMDRT